MVLTLCKSLFSVTIWCDSKQQATIKIILINVCLSINLIIIIFVDDGHDCSIQITIKSSLSIIQNDSINDYNAAFVLMPTVPDGLPTRWQLNETNNYSSH